MGQLAAVLVQATVIKRVLMILPSNRKDPLQRLAAQVLHYLQNQHLHYYSLMRYTRD